MKRIVLILSGGLDSTTLLYDLIKRKDVAEIKALSFDYGQKHKKELKFAKKTCDNLIVEHKIVNLRKLKNFLKSSLTTKEEVPEGHYADDNMKSTVVPNRNMIMLSVAIGYAISEGFNAVAYAAHAGDHTIYPDCRPVFVEKIKELAKVVDYNPIDVIVPYSDINKNDILKRGIKLGVDYGLTWTCYKGKRKACGKCGSCVERLEAFKSNGLKDPIKYE